MNDGVYRNGEFINGKYLSGAFQVNIIGLSVDIIKLCKYYGIEIDYGIFHGTPVSIIYNLGYDYLEVTMECNSFAGKVTIRKEYNYPTELYDDDYYDPFTGIWITDMEIILTNYDAETDDDNLFTDATIPTIQEYNRLLYIEDKFQELLKEFINEVIHRNKKANPTKVI